MTTDPPATAPIVRILTVTRGPAAAELVRDLYRQQDQIRAVAGLPVEFSGVHAFGGPVDRMVLTAAWDLIARARPWIVVEALGLPGPAAAVAVRALTASATVISASPELAVRYAPLLHDLAAGHGAAFLFAGAGRPLTPLAVLALRPLGAARAVLGDPAGGARRPAAG
ncbi:MAG: hypothetical protein ACJ786_29735 [Catenulispora sp.]